MDKQNNTVELLEYEESKWSDDEDQEQDQDQEPEYPVELSFTNKDDIQSNLYDIIKISTWGEFERVRRKSSKFTLIL